MNSRCVFAVFEAPDTVLNLHIAFDRYIDQVDDLQGSEWRGKTMRIFMSGEYEFLCKMFGLSGASGMQ